MKDKLKLLEESELTRVSSKGQVVIPQNMRKELHIEKGDIFAVTTLSKEIIILKRVQDKILEEELEILRSAKDAWEEIERGESTISSKEDFLKELKKW